jgi:hypothetical protein
MRRIALSFAAALLLLACASDASAAPRATDFSVRLGDAGPPSTARAASAQHARPWTSRVIRTKRRFEIVGLRWASARDHVDGQLRVRENGRWRRWTEIPHADSVRGSDPMWAGGATAVQLRLDRRVRGLRLHFVSVRGVRGAARRVRARAAANQPPAIVSREQWGASQCVPRDVPSLGEVKLGFVHHTVSANGYGREDSAAMVLGICRFHRNANGWDDIGYNFLVDKYGTVFEGRAGGIDQPVVGAQAQGFNAVSTGVANLGTYEDVPQTPQAIESMARLLAWKLPLHGAPVTGRVTVASAGGSSNRYPRGAQVTFERISGHRDGNETACPGAQLYAQLPGLRERADRLAPDVTAPPPPGPASGAPARLSLEAMSLAIAYPEPARLAGRLTDAAGTGIAGTRVRLQVLTARGFRAVASTVSGPDGGFTAELPTSWTRVVRALAGSLASDPVRVTVAPALTVPAPARRVQAGRRAVVRGRIQPRKASVVVEAARQLSATRYATPLRLRGRAKGGRFRIAVPLTRPGVYRLRVRFRGDRRNAPAQLDHFVRAVRRLAARSGSRGSGSGGQAAR